MIAILINNIEIIIIFDTTKKGWKFEGNACYLRSERVKVDGKHLPP